MLTYHLVHPGRVPKASDVQNLINNFLNDPLVRDVFEAEETVDIDKALEYGPIDILTMYIKKHLGS